MRSATSRGVPNPFFSLSLPRGGWGTLASLRGASPLCAPHVGAQLPHPQRGGRSAPPPRVTFSPMRKSPKNLPEGATPSGYSPWGALSSPQRRCRSPQKDSPIGRRGRCGLVLPSAPDRGLGLPIALPLSRKKTAECPVGSTGRTWQIEAD